MPILPSPALPEPPLPTRLNELGLLRFWCLLVTGLAIPKISPTDGPTGADTRDFWWATTTRLESLQCPAGLLLEVARTEADRERNPGRMGLGRQAAKLLRGGSSLVKCMSYLEVVRDCRKCGWVAFLLLVIEHSSELKELRLSKDLLPRHRSNPKPPFPVYRLPCSEEGKNPFSGGALDGRLLAPPNTGSTGLASEGVPGTVTGATPATKASASFW